MTRSGRCTHTSESQGTEPRTYLGVGWGVSGTIVELFFFFRLSLLLLIRNHRETLSYGAGIYFRRPRGLVLSTPRPVPSPLAGIVGARRPVGDSRVFPSEWLRDRMSGWRESLV